MILKQLKNVGEQNSKVPSQVELNVVKNLAWKKNFCWKVSPNLKSNVSDLLAKKRSSKNFEIS